MNERDITTALTKSLKSELKGAKIIKHSDRATSSIPDMTVSWRGNTYWLEIKFRRPGKAYKDVIGIDQLITCGELSTTTNNKCWVVCYELDKTKRLTIWQPRRLAAEVFPRMSHDERMGLEYIDTRPWLRDHRATLDKFGVSRYDGWLHEEVAALIREF